MPPRYTTNQVKDLFADYGYVVPQNFVYHNNKTKVHVYDEMNGVYEDLSLQQLQYRTDRAATRRPRYFDPDLMNIQLSNTGPTDNSSFERWCAHQPEEFNDMDDETKHEAFDMFRQTIPHVARHQNADIDFDDYNNIAQLYGLVSALRTANYNQFDIRLTIRDVNDNITYAHANENTVNYLFNSFIEHLDVSDSNEALLNTVVDVKHVHIEFIPKTNTGRNAPGFFPFINKSEIDLSPYGIYQREEDVKNESCLITAIRSSGLLDEKQMDLLQSMIKTRNVMKTDLRKISKEFKFNVHVRTIKEGGKDSHYEIINDQTYPLLKLVVVMNHYMINTTTMAFDKRPSTIQTIIKKLGEKNLLAPLSDATIDRLIKTYEPKDERTIEGNIRPVIVEDAKVPSYRTVKQTKRFFGYAPANDEIDDRLDELQEVINKLPLRHKINVRDYYKFSDLGQKILYETGCYDGVYEMTGKKANEIRDKLVFPKTRLINREKFYSNETLYYLDINAAYMNFVKSIPSGKDDGYVNDRVGEVIRMLYNLRVKAKNDGHDKLAKTLKFIMNSTWGYSIMRPKVIKNKYVQNVDSYVQKYNRFVLKVKDHFVSTVNTFVPHYTFPQFARSVLDEYNKFFDKIKSMVHVFYENVDAILTDKEGYETLVSQGLVGNDMGQFKVEKVFKEIAIISNRQYVATTVNDERVFHCTKKDYDDVVRIAKQ